MTINTSKRGTYEITEQVEQLIQASGIREGLCNLFVSHTSCSLIICENADFQVQKDLEVFLTDLVKDGDPRFKHTAEGDDDMPAHIRSILTQVSLSIPIQNHRLALGTWQGIFLYEHRTHSHHRKIVITLLNAD